MDRGVGMRYESNPKHRQPWQRGRRGSLCPETVGLKAARGLLSASEPVGDKRYAVHEGRAYCAQEHGAGAWHGYPVGWREVPESLRRMWLAQGCLRKQDVRKHWGD